MKILDKLFGKTKTPETPMPIYRSRRAIEEAERRAKLTAAGKPVGKKMMAAICYQGQPDEFEAEIYHQHDFWFDVWFKEKGGEWGVVVSGDFGDCLFREKNGDKIADTITDMLQEMYQSKVLKNNAMNLIQTALETLRRVDA